MAYRRPVTAWWSKLVEAAPSATALLAAPGVQDRITGGFAVARERFPEAAGISDDALAAALGVRLAAQKDPATALARLRVDDLLLAQWCATGDPRAIGAFERVHRPDLDAVLAGQGG